MVKILNDISDPLVIQVLSEGGLVVLKTDTIYGIVAKADDHTAVNKVYELKHRNQAKSPVVLISNVDQMFDRLPKNYHHLTSENWPERTSIILPSDSAPQWIKRGNASVAYRVPNVNALRQLIQSTGALIAPSANPEDHPPALNIEQAIDYFGDLVDVYVDGGQVDDPAASQILRVSKSGQVERLR